MSMNQGCTFLIYREGYYGDWLCPHRQDRNYGLLHVAGNADDATNRAILINTNQIAQLKQQMETKSVEWDRKLDLILQRQEYILEKLSTGSNIMTNIGKV